MHASDRPNGSINTMIGWGLMAVVVLSAVPAASNRPVFWVGWAAVVIGLALVSVASGAWRPSRDLLNANKVLFALIAGIPLWAIVQTLPGLGPWVGTLPVSSDLQPSSISLAPYASLLAAMRITGYLVFFGLILQVARNTVRAERMAWVVFFGVAAHAIYALVALHLLGDQFFWGEKTAYRGFATGTFINRNAFASFLGMGMCLGVGLMMQRGKSHPQSGRILRRVERLGMAVLLTLMGATLVMTGSRMGVAASGVAVAVVLIVMRLKNGARLGRVLLRLSVGLAPLIGVIFLLYGLEFLWRLVFSVADAGYRLTIYATVLEMIGQRPLSGFGLDAFEPSYEIFRGPDAVAQLITEYAHSSYLGNWVELGVIVGSLPLIAAGLAALRIIRTIAKASAKDVTLPVVSLGALCLLALHATIDFSFEIQANVFLLLFLLGLGLAAPKPEGR